MFEKTNFQFKKKAFFFKYPDFVKGIFLNYVMGHGWLGLEIVGFYHYYDYWVGRGLEN